MKIASTKPTKPAKTRPTSGRVSHPDIKSTVKGSENTKQSGKVKVNEINNGKKRGKNTASAAAAAAAKVYSSGRINSSGKVSTNGKAAVNVNVVPKASSSNRKASAVKQTNAATKASNINTQKSTKKTGTVHETLASRYGVKKGFRHQSLAKPPFTKTPPRNTNSPAHTRSPALFTIPEKSVTSIKSNQSPPFNKAAVSGTTISTSENLRKKPTNGYQQVQNEEPMLAVQSFISNLIVQAFKTSSPQLIP